MLTAQLGEIYLDLLSRDPRLQEAFRAIDGRSAAEVALESFIRARDLDAVELRGGVGRWNPQIIWCSFLAMRERILEGEFEVARAHAERVIAILQLLRETDREMFSTDAAGSRWLGRAEAWRDVADAMVRLLAASSEGNESRVAEETTFVTKRLDEIRERYPEDKLAKEVRDADDLKERGGSR